MPSVDLDKALEVARETVRNAKREGTLRQLTNRIVRKQVEQTLSLDEGTLDEGDYKKAVGQVVKDTLLEAQEDADSELEPPPESKEKSKSAKKRKSDEKDDIVKPKPAKKRKENEGENGETAETVSKKKSSIRSDAKTNQGSKSTEIKSKSEISDADGEAVNRGPDNAKEGTKPSSTDKDFNMETASGSHVPHSSGGSSSKHASSLKKTELSKPRETKTVTNPEPHDEKSDSELSVLIDESPKRKRKLKSKEKMKTKTETKVKKSKDDGKALSPDEEQIKRLKALVFACGVRKSWIKELKGLDTSSRQIAHLRSILTDLGMKGRFSMEQSKAIKAKREFAREMEDVREFAEKFVGDERPKRTKGTKVAVTTINMDEDEEAEDVEVEVEDEEIAPTRRGNAQRSIMAFLGDQSDDDE